MVLEYLAILAGIVMSVGLIPQISKIYANKSAKDISPSTFLTLVIGMFVWVLYGFEINDIPVIINSTLAFIGYLLIFVGWVFYHK